MSVISVWEISVKYKRGKLSLPVPPDEFVSYERKSHLIAALPLFEKDIHHLTKLPDINRDPFDRMLVYQAIEGAFTILTPDPLIRQYPIRTIWETV